jgi:hypothetical protein
MHCIPFLVFLSVFDPITCGSLIHFIGRKAGEYWCTALARQPETILWLLEDEQILLAEWMIWVSGSLPALRRILRNQSLQNQSSQSQDSQSDVVRQIMLHLLDRLLSNATPKIPDARTVLDWLTIHPPGIERMHLIAIDDTGDDRARQFAKLSMICSELVLHTPYSRLPRIQTNTDIPKVSGCAGQKRICCRCWIVQLLLSVNKTGLYLD